MRRLPSLNALRAFEAAARHESFSRAARELCVTHGAISKHVSQLETRLGVALFRRAPGRLALTDAGRAYQVEIGLALDRIAAATASLAAGEHAHSLKINAPPTFTIKWLVPRLSRFQIRYPALEIRLQTRRDNAVAALQDADIVIRRGPPDWKRVRSIAFLQEAITPVCHPRLVKRRRLHRPADLGAQTWLYAEARPEDWSAWLAVAKAQPVRPVRSLHFDHTSLALEAAGDAMGVAMGPLSMIRGEMEAATLVAPFPALIAPTDAYYAIHAQGRETDGKVTAFCDWLMSEGAGFRHETASARR